MIDILGMILGLLAFNLYLDRDHPIKKKKKERDKWILPPCNMYTLNSIYEETALFTRDLTEDQVKKIDKGVDSSN